jgi:hypothetical protein
MNHAPRPKAQREPRYQGPSHKTYTKYSQTPRNEGPNAAERESESENGDRPTHIIKRSLLNE